MAIQTIGKAISSTYLKKSTTVTFLPEIEAVELTDEEKSFAIYDAKAAKYFRLQDERKHEARLAAMQEAARPWSEQEMLKHALSALNGFCKVNGREMVLDNFVKPVLGLLSLYFTNSPEFEKKGNFSLKKGIMLVGNVGVGKTDLLKSFSKNKTGCFLPISANDITAIIRKNGSYYWKAYTGYVPYGGQTAEYFFQPNIGWMIDDIGTEEVVTDWGNRIDALDMIIQERYLHRDKIPMRSLHITSNMNPEMLKNRYGSRFESRLYDMFNVIQLDGVDRRKIK